MKSCKRFVNILNSDIPLKNANFPSSLSKAEVMWLGNPLQKWPIGMGYPSITWLLRTLQNHLSWKRKNIYQQPARHVKRSYQKSNKVWWVYLEHKHFSSENGDGVKVSITDVGAKVRLVWWICGLGAVVRRTGCYRRGLRAWSRTYMEKAHMGMIFLDLTLTFTHHPMLVLLDQKKPNDPTWRQ